jgi:hypothetical protein
MPIIDNRESTKQAIRQAELDGLFNWLRPSYRVKDITLHLTQFSGAKLGIYNNSDDLVGALNDKNYFSYDESLAEYIVEQFPNAEVIIVDKPQQLVTIPTAWPYTEPCVWPTQPVYPYIWNNTYNPFESWGGPQKKGL